MQYRYDHLQY